MIVDVAKTNTAAARAPSTNMNENDAALACSRVSRAERRRTLEPVVGDEARQLGDAGPVHGHEQQAAAEEHRCEEAVLLVPDPVADDAQEPEERDARERRQVERGDGRAGLRDRLEPRHQPGAVEAVRRSPGQQQHRADEQDRKGDPGDPGGARCPPLQATHGGVRRRLARRLPLSSSTSATLTEHGHLSVRNSEAVRLISPSRRYPSDRDRLCRRMTVCDATRGGHRATAMPGFIGA